MFIYYIVKNKLNGKRYVGKTVINVEHRWKKHLVDSFSQLPPAKAGGLSE